MTVRISQLPKRKTLNKMVDDLREYLEHQGFVVVELALTSKTPVEPVHTMQGIVGFNTGPAITSWNITTQTLKPLTKKELRKRAAADRKSRRLQEKRQKLHNEGKCGDECSICEDERLDAMDW